MTVGDRIRKTRTAMGWSRPRLAKEAGVPYPTLAGLENGDQLKSTALIAIANALGVDPGWLSSGESQPQLTPALSGCEVELVAAFRDLSGPEQELVLRMISGLAPNRGP
jgi:transcriptional regulator with XRE-family HTH domain